IRPLFASVAFLASTTAYSASTHDDLEAQAYHYGMPLDIVRVISSEVPSTIWCKVVEGRLVYLNSRGEREAITYRTLSSACSNS
ncbi:TPA: DUF2790 domain-containing protein, partial [Pseudomonas aeruginosa]|nr:DUF2790 domain-containing protein [Pseudomonas aeruginosa]